MVDVKQAAKLGNVVIEPGSRTQRDIANLDYSLDDVIACLSSLQEHEFNDCSVITLTARQNRSRDVFADSYVTKFAGPTGVTDRLYVKFRVAATWLTVHSFHLATR